VNDMSVQKPDEGNDEVPCQVEYATPDELTKRRRDLFAQQGLSLKTPDGTRYEWFITAGSSKDISPTFRHGGIEHRLFTSVDMGVALTFGMRGIGKAKGGELVGVIILIEASLVRLLEMEGLLTEAAIDIGGREYIFEPAAARTLNESSRWIYLPPEFFRR
jgi:hypothetical protein